MLDLYTIEQSYLELFWELQCRQWENQTTDAQHDLTEMDVGMHEQVSGAAEMAGSLSGLFESALWEQPSQAEELYLEHYSRIGLEPESPTLWVLDSFRTIDPVYIHSYVLGDGIARDTVACLRERYGKDLPRWGSWLRRNYYADGRRRSLAEKTAVLRSPKLAGPFA